MPHRDLPPVDLDGVASQQSAERAYVLVDAPPRQGSLPEHRPCGEAGPDDDREATGRDVLDRRDRRRGGEHVAQVRDDQRTETDALGVVGNPRQRHPDVPVTRASRAGTHARSRAPRRARPFDAARPRREAAGEVHRHGPGTPESVCRPRARLRRARAGSSGRERRAARATGGSRSRRARTRRGPCRASASGAAACDTFSVVGEHVGPLGDAPADHDRRTAPIASTRAPRCASREQQHERAEPAERRDDHERAARATVRPSKR